MTRLASPDTARVLSEFAGTHAAVCRTALASPLPTLRALAANVRCMFEMLCDRDFQLSWQVSAALLFALAYFVSPFDAVPDALPVVGFLDDAALVAELALLASVDMKRWKLRRAARLARP